MIVQRIKQNTITKKTIINKIEKQNKIYNVTGLKIK